MSKQTTNFLCEVETAIFVIAIFAGMISTKLTCAAWLTLAIAILIHSILDRSYLKEWCKWMWK